MGKGRGWIAVRYCVRGFVGPIWSRLGGGGTLSLSTGMLRSIKCVILPSPA
jgi:hypothetical protein